MSLIWFYLLLKLTLRRLDTLKICGGSVFGFNEKRKREFLGERKIEWEEFSLQGRTVVMSS